jgi:POT family proton-dependent oligopeptide transporter
VQDNVVSEVALNEKDPYAVEKAPSETPDGEEPTAEEAKNLRHIAENLPVSAWLVAIVELCERFTYYGMSGLFQNYVNNPLDGSKGRGALGLGHQGATGLTTFFQFWCYGETCHTRTSNSDKYTDIIGSSYSYSWCHHC